MKEPAPRICLRPGKSPLAVAFLVSLPKACSVIRLVCVTRSVRRCVAGIAVAILAARDRIVALAFSRVGLTALASRLEPARECGLLVLLGNDASRDVPAGSLAVGLLGL